MIPQTQHPPSHKIERVDASTAGGLFQELGELHVSAIHEGVLEALGPGFVGTVYQQLSKDRGVFIYTARREGTLVGFLAGSINVARSLRAIGSGGLVRLVAAAALHLWRPRLLKQVIDAAGYFFQRGGPGDERMAAASAGDRAELLAIAVIPEAHGQGIGKSLIGAFEQDLRDAGDVRRYFVSTNSTETGSNAFYRSAGFQFIGQRPHHRILCSVYAKNLTGSIA